MDGKISDSIYLSQTFLSKFRFMEKDLFAWGALNSTGLRR